MRRKNLAPLTKSDLADFVSKGSDFALEMTTLGKLRSLGLETEHAATYVDPVTNRIRAYDLRARWNRGCRAISFAIECKNLRPSEPLLVHATPRLSSESYHTVVTRVRVGGYLLQSTHARTNIYAEGAPVGRQTDQPSKDESGEFRSSDTVTYEKWMQAVNGCFDLIKEVAKRPLGSPQVHAVVPILVVPDGTLWQIDYDTGGDTRNSVHQVERTTLILRHKWSIPAALSVLEYDTSHLEIVTVSALRQRLKNLLDDGGLLMGAEALLETAQS